MLWRNTEGEDGRMCYVIAISKCLEGCVALKVQPGRELVALKKEIYRKVGYESIELVTISRPSIYGSTYLIDLSKQWRISN